jgi:hypothetical protein
MTLPVGIVTKTVHFGPFLDDYGVPFSGSVSVVADTDKIWEATGTPIYARTKTLQLDAAGTTEFELIAVDQPGFTDGEGNDISDWTYTATVQLEGRANSGADIRGFQVRTTDPADIDFDLLVPVPTSGGITIAASVVTSVNGATGDVTVTGSGLTAGTAAGQTIIWDPATGGGAWVIGRAVVQIGNASARPATGAFNGSMYYAGDTETLSVWNAFATPSAAWEDIQGGGGSSPEELEAAVEAYLLANPPAPGDDGEAPMLQATSTHIQWKLPSSGSWTNLVALDDITGADGATGPAGPAVEMQNDGTTIQWRYPDDGWSNLIALEDLTGPPGPEGPEGPAGSTDPLVLEAAIDDYFTTHPVDGLAPGVVTDEHVSDTAAIGLSKTVDTVASGGRLAMTTSERDKLGSYPNDFTVGVQTTIGDSLVAGTLVGIDYDEVTHKTTISVPTTTLTGIIMLDETEDVPDGTPAGSILLRSTAGGGDPVDPEPSVFTVMTGAGNVTVGESTNVGDTVTLASPANAKIGDLLVAVVCSQSSTGTATWSTPAGWVKSFDPSTGSALSASRHMAVFTYKIDDSADLAALGATTNFVLTGTSGRWAGAMMRVINADMTPHLSRSAYSPTTATTSALTWPAYTAAEAAAGVVAFAWTQTSAGAAWAVASAVPTVNSGWVEVARAVGTAPGGGPPLGGSQLAVWWRPKTGTSIESDGVAFSPVASSVAAGYQFSIQGE